MSEKGLYVEINQQTLMDKGVGPWAEGLYLFLSSHSRPLKIPTKSLKCAKELRGSEFPCQINLAKNMSVLKEASASVNYST